MDAYATLMAGVEEGATRLAHDTGTATTAFVGHRYGDDAKRVSEATVAIAGNVGRTVMATQKVGRKMARKTVKSALGEVVRPSADAPGTSAAHATPSPGYPSRGDHQTDGGPHLHPPLD